ncbi:hypothetical protein LPJ56_001228 [Coemansia sp. RSA 2599]|nr:hypothetical protein LPJ56_001228 [Coemansia sp. RSA 2599]
MAFGGRAACMRREMLPIAIRNFMPDHPVEQRPRDEMAVEEHELESRVPESTGRGNSEPEVLFSAPKDIDDDRISPDAANATASSSNNNANSTAKTSAKAAGLSLSGSKDKSGSSNKNDGGDDDDWNDNWGEEDEEEIVSMPGPKPSASLTANKQAKND